MSNDQSLQWASILLGRCAQFTSTRRAPSTGSDHCAASGAIGYYERESDGTLIAKIASDGAEYYYVTDGIGSVITMVDTGSNTVATYSYDPYGGHGVIGHPDAPDNTVGEANPYRYAGGYRDAATGLVKFGDRYYDPDLGRWTQIDPHAHLLSLAQGNPYSYAGNNPVNQADGSGKDYQQVTAPPGFKSVGCSNSPDHVGKVDLTGPCAYHDQCYGQRAPYEGASRGSCDTLLRKLIFFNCVQVALSSGDDVSGFEQARCNVIANDYYGGVRIGGSSSFEG